MPGREFMGTQFGRMCQKLDMRIIAANSAPAKGRVERGNGTHQDRLINKMGRQKIRTHEAAKPVSAGRIFSRSQRSFCAGASGTAGLSSQGPKVREWEQVFCLETERSISHDWVVRYENHYFQLERTSDYPPRQAKVRVCEWEDERIEIRYQGKAQPHREIEAPEAKPPLRSGWKRSDRRVDRRGNRRRVTRGAGRGAAAAMRRAMRIGDIFNE